MFHKSYRVTRCNLRRNLYRVAVPRKSFTVNFDKIATNSKKDDYDTNSQTILFKVGRMHVSNLGVKGLIPNLG